MWFGTKRAVMRCSRLRPLTDHTSARSKPQAHLDEPVIQVDQHHVVPAIGCRVVEGDRADVLGVGCSRPSAHAAQLCFRAGRVNIGLPD